MSKITFKYPSDVKASCRVTGVTGTIVCRSENINGGIVYTIQPKNEKEDSNYVPDATVIDEEYVSGVEAVNEEVEFKFNTGDKVKNMVNGFEGTITRRMYWLNKCIQYIIEGQMVMTERHGMTATTNKAWEQEIALQEGIKPLTTNKKRTGGDIERTSTVERIAL